MDNDKKLICYKCNVELKPTRTHFTYLDHSFYADMPKCPQCGQVYIPESIVKGRMAEVEAELEDK